AAAALGLNFTMGSTRFAARYAALNVASASIASGQAPPTMSQATVAAPTIETPDATRNARRHRSLPKKASPNEIASAGARGHDVIRASPISAPEANVSAKPGRRDSSRAARPA